VKALSLDKTWYQNLNKAYRQRQQKAFELMDLLNCQYDKNQRGLFVWAKIPSRYKDCYELADDILYKSNVFITPGGIFGTNGERYIRASLCGKVEVFEEAIRRVSSVGVPQ